VSPEALLQPSGRGTKEHAVEFALWPHYYGSYASVQSFCASDTEGNAFHHWYLRVTCLSDRS
jgi:hypothetical protein